MAGNQLGKTLAGSAEMAMHLTGRYPNWWPGRRFTTPIRAWAAGVTGVSTRDTVQKLLIGPAENRELWGSGAIPGECLEGYGMHSGLADAIDHVSIRHASGGLSALGFKTYEQGRKKWQGETLHVVWFDEEPPEDIYSEGLTRTNATNGLVYLTFTPLLGRSKVVLMFLSDPEVQASIGDILR